MARFAKGCATALVKERRTEDQAAFVYHERSPEVWHRRAHQSRENFVLEPKPATPRVEPLKESKSKSKLPAITGSTRCVCGHCRDSHEYPLPAHPPLLASLSTRCVVNTGCECPAFCPTDRKPTIPRAPVGLYTPCAKCGHGRGWHCTKHKPGAVARLKSPSEVAYKILSKLDGTHYPCKHLLPNDPACQCTSSSCSYAVGNEYCECEKFVNSSLTPRKRVATNKRAPRKVSAVSPEVAATVGTPESILAGEPDKPRKSRQKKTALVTGQELFSPGEASVNP